MMKSQMVISVWVLALTDSNIVPADFGRLKVKDQSINKRMIGTYEGNISGDKDI